MRELLGLLLLFYMAACNEPAGSKEQPVVKDTVAATAAETTRDLNYIHQFTDTALEHKITTALLKLPFVQKSNTYIDSLSNHKHGISFMLDSTGNSEKEISVQAGYNGEQRFETYYHFYVNPQTLEIKVYDPVNDKKLSVKAFIKSQQ